MQTTWQQELTSSPAVDKKKNIRNLSLSRKDTIIISVLINVALLAVLFATATREPYRNIVETKKREIHEIASKQYPSSLDHEPILSHEPIDEIDEIVSRLTRNENLDKKPISQLTPKNMEVTVGPGDALSKIAKKYGVKVEEIQSANNLSGSKLKIGQILRIPNKDVSDTSNKVASPVKKATPTIAAPSTTEKQPNVQYYVIQSGDNPWKIARKFHLKFEELLELNNLDEGKARSLRIGQKIRIR